MYLPQFTFCWMICFMRFARFESTCARLFGCADFMTVSFYRKICFWFQLFTFLLRSSWPFPAALVWKEKIVGWVQKLAVISRCPSFPPSLPRYFSQKYFTPSSLFFSNLGSIWCVRWKYSSLTFFGKRFRFSQNISPSFVCDLHIQDYSNLFRPNKFWLLG